MKYLSDSITNIYMIGLANMLQWFEKKSQNKNNK